MNGQTERRRWSLAGRTGGRWMRIGRVAGLALALLLGGSPGARVMPPGAAETAWAAPDPVDEAKEKSLAALEAIARAIEDLARKTREQAQKTEDAAGERLRSSVERACDAAQRGCEKVCEGNSQCLRACKEGRRLCQA
jgi:hypothetical protein